MVGSDSFRIEGSNPPELLGEGSRHCYYSSVDLSRSFGEGKGRGEEGRKRRLSSQDDSTLTILNFLIPLNERSIDGNLVESRERMGHRCGQNGKTLEYPYSTILIVIILGEST